jgi:hypothetical protein
MGIFVDEFGEFCMLPAGGSAHEAENMLYGRVAEAFA